MYYLDANPFQEGGAHLRGVEESCSSCGAAPHSAFPRNTERDSSLGQVRAAGRSEEAFPHPAPEPAPLSSAVTSRSLDVSSSGRPPPRGRQGFKTEDFGESLTENPQQG